MQEKSAAFAESKVLAKSGAETQLGELIVKLFEECTKEILFKCEAWVSNTPMVGSTGNAESLEEQTAFWRGALEGVITKLKPIHQHLNLDVATKEGQAFLHTATVVVFAARALRKDSSAPASTIALLEAPATVAWPLVAIVLGAPS